MSVKQGKNRIRPRYAYTAAAAAVPVPGRDEEAVYYTRHEAVPLRQRRIGDQDVVEVFLLTFYFCVAALVPSSHWDGICRFMSRVRPETSAQAVHRV